jgi:mRNA interferase MazF
MPEQGDILLVPIPFTDLSSQKRRPVIVISNNSYNKKMTDIIVVAMTSNPVEAAYSFSITSDDLEKGTLNHPGKVRVDKIYTISTSIVVKTFGRVNEKVLEKIGMVHNWVTLFGQLPFNNLKSVTRFHQKNEPSQKIRKELQRLTAKE